MSFRGFFAKISLCFGASLGTAAAASGPMAVEAGIGVDEIFAGHDQHVVHTLELMLPGLAAGFEPVVDATVNGAGASFVGAGVAYRLETVKGFDLRVAACPGIYDHGEGKDLGGHFQILSVVEGTWRVMEHGRIGLRLGHLSNASTRATNPGTEILVATYEIDWR